jgi:hypothetical protein
MVPDAGDTGGDRDAGQAPAVTERVHGEFPIRAPGESLGVHYR